MERPGLPWIWISYLGSTIYSIDISMDISMSFSLKCHIINFEYTLIPPAIQRSLRKWRRIDMDISMDG